MSRIERTLLVEPKNGYYTGFQGIVQSGPLGLEYVAGAITPYTDVRIFDDRVDKREIVDEIRNYRPDLVGIRCNYTADVLVVREYARKIREEVGADVPIVVGGHHISLRPQDMFTPDVSAVVVGPGEIPFTNVVRSLNERGYFDMVPSLWYQDREGQFVSNVRERPSTNLVVLNSEAMNERPIPRRDLVEKYLDGYYFLYYPKPRSLETARGCKYRCSFCSVHNFHSGEYEVEGANRTVQEMLGLKARGAKYINIIDDLAFTDLDAAEKIATGLIDSKADLRFWAQIRADNVILNPNNSMISDRERQRHLDVFARLAEAGLDTVLMGLESFDPAELKRVNKGSTVRQNIEAVQYLRSLGIKIWGAQIIFPQWGVEDYDRLIEINQELGIEYPQLTILTPLPGTKDYREAKESGKLLTDDPSKFDFFHWTVETKLPAEETYRQISRVYRETSPFAKRPDGTFVNMRDAMRHVKSIKADISAGRTTEAAVAGFTQIFRNLQDPEVHLEHLRMIEQVVT